MQIWFVSLEWPGKVEDHSFSLCSSDTFQQVVKKCAKLVYIANPVITYWTLSWKPYMTRLLQWEQINKEVKKSLSALVTQFLLSQHICEKCLGTLNIKQTLQQVHKTLFQDGFAEKSTTHEREAGKGRERERDCKYCHNLCFLWQYL